MLTDIELTTFRILLVTTVVFLYSFQISLQIVPMILQTYPILCHQVLMRAWGGGPLIYPRMNFLSVDLLQKEDLPQTSCTIDMESDENAEDNNDNPKDTTVGASFKSNIKNGNNITRNVYNTGWLRRCNSEPAKGCIHLTFARKLFAFN